MLDNNRTILYFRVSTSQQANSGLGLDAQEQRCRDYAQYQKLDIITTFTDAGVSASKPFFKRPEGSKILELVKSRVIDHLVILRLDRAFRNTVDALQTIELLKQCNVSLHIVDLGGLAVNANTPSGKLFLTMLAAISEFELSLICERNKARVHQIKELGRHNGIIPTGYKKVDGVLVPDDNLEILRAAKAMRSSGKTLAQVCDYLNAEGVRPRRAKTWTPHNLASVLDHLK
jgi:site-specific DNA recombinase